MSISSLYEKASATVVIDHHRKSVDYIKDALIFFHDPNASSTCEMVTELMRYITPAPSLSATEAQAMLAGIMLDTKEFVLSTGVRTFEAAAFLKGKGADTVAVKRLFSNSIESNRKRSEIISAAHIYRGCAIACTAPERRTRDCSARRRQTSCLKSAESKRRLLSSTAEMKVSASRRAPTAI